MPSRVWGRAGVKLGWALHDRDRRAVTVRCRCPPYDHLACHLHEAGSGGITAVGKQQIAVDCSMEAKPPDVEAEGE